MAQELVVKIVGDSRSLERAMKKSERSVKRFEGSAQKASRSFGGLGKGLVGAGAGIGVAAVLKDSVLAASDLEQQMAKTNTVFGDSAREVEDWSRTLAESFGLSQREALTTASTLGALFAPIGLTGEAAAKQSQKLTELGADLASFYNTDVQSALDAIRSGLVGESEPLRKYGVLLSETRVQQQAMADTGKKNAKSLTDQEKVLARIKIVFGDSKTAQGDFARTSDDAAQKVKIFKAEVENLKAELGGGLVPALASAAGYATDFINAMRSDSPWNKGLLQQFQDIRSKLPSFMQGPAGVRKWKLPFTSDGERKEIDGFRVAGKAFADALRAVGQAVAGSGGAAVVNKISSTLRAAREATRQEAQDRAAFAVEKTALTKTLADDLAALRRYNALLTKRMKGGHKTLELEREQLGVQLQIQDILRQQAEARKKQDAQKKKMGVDVTRFQKTATGQFALAGGGGRGVVISGGVHLHGIRNVEQMERELGRRRRQRARSRRSNR